MTRNLVRSHEEADKRVEIKKKDLHSELYSQSSVDGAVEMCCAACNGSTYPPLQRNLVHGALVRMDREL